MSRFNYRDASLFVENVALADIADVVGTPCYVYSRAAIESKWREYHDAVKTRPHKILYAVKANSNLAVLGVLAGLGSGFDIVSNGELNRVLTAGGGGDVIVFAGVGKTRAELKAALKAGIACFNVESKPELKRLSAVAADLGVRAPIAIRVNPDVDPITHPYIATGLHENKFGVSIDEARRLYSYAADDASLNVIGIDCHIGSQLTDLAPYRDAVRRVVALADELVDQGIPIAHIDVGGGLGIRYRDESVTGIAEFVAAICRLIDARYTVWLEPGRSIAGPAGVLLTEVQYIKQTPKKKFVVVDAAMNDFLRPSLYDAWHDVKPLVRRDGGVAQRFDIVGPICETGDFIARERDLVVAEGDRLAVMDAGAYGFVMASAYNSRPRAAEVLVDNDKFSEVRHRDSLTDLIRGEVCLDQIEWH